MTKKEILTLRLRLRTIRDKVAHGIFRLALRFPQKCKIFGGPMVITITIIVIAGLGLSSCNVTRTVTTRSEAWQKGDTSVVIQTKTVETYDASKQAADLAAFNAQKNDKGGKPTMRTYLWAIEAEAYDENNG